MCISTCNVTIGEPAILECITTSTDVSCNGDADGTASVTTIGGTLPYVYSWIDGQTTAVATGLIAGTYSVTTTDANGCDIICNVDVVEPMVLTCSLVVENADCSTGLLGSLTVSNTGGIPPLEYSLDGLNWQAGNVFNNLLAGTYTVFVRDANLCVSTCDAEVLNVNCDFDLALIKTINASPPAPYMPGGLVTFDITVVNQGSLDAFNVNANDYIPAGLTLTDPAWIAAGGVATMVAPIASLPAGTQTVVPITFTIDPNFMGTSITNNAEISEADDDTDPTNTPPTDVDSTPATEDGTTPDPNDDDTADAAGGDDYDPETIMIGQIFDLALIKTISASPPAPYMPGGLVTFDITVVNQGSLDAFNVNVNDYIPAGLTLTDPAWIAAGGVATMVVPIACLLYTSPSPRDQRGSRMPSSA